jgi:hypothetical protein
MSETLSFFGVDYTISSRAREDGVGGRRAAVIPALSDPQNRRDRTAVRYLKVTMRPGVS